MTFLLDRGVSECLAGAVIEGRYYARKGGEQGSHYQSGDSHDWETDIAQLRIRIGHRIIAITSIEKDLPTGDNTQGSNPSREGYISHESAVDFCRKVLVEIHAPKGLLLDLATGGGDIGGQAAALLLKEQKEAVTPADENESVMGDGFCDPHTTVLFQARGAYAGKYYTVPPALNDQARLARIAIEENDIDGVVYEAIRRLTDQDFLAEVALESPLPYVSERAANRLTNPKLLARVGGKNSYTDLNDFISTRMNAIAALDELDPAIKRLAGDLRISYFEHMISVARIKLAIQETCIRDRIPGIVVTSERTPIGGQYYGYTMPGESVTIRLSWGGGTLAECTWSTEFPQKTKAVNFKPAYVDGGELLARLFRLPVFSLRDLTDLSRSEIPEVRRAAVAHLRSQVRLGKIARDDPDSYVRLAAESRIKALVGED